VYGKKGTVSGPSDTGYLPGGLLRGSCGSATGLPSGPASLPPAGSASLAVAARGAAGMGQRCIAPATISGRTRMLARVA
jgi:hypothetical protein